MAEYENFGASFSIDTTQLKAGLAQANRLIRESESEFRAAAAGMDDWRYSQDGLQARIKYLNSAIDVQRKKVDALTKDYEQQIADGLDPTSRAAVELRTAINKEQAALAKNEKELRTQTEALSELSKDSKKATQDIEDTGKAAEKSGEGFTIAKGAIAGFISNGLSALVGACKNAVSSLMNLAESTREYREDIGKLETAFETAGFTTEVATKAYKELYSVIGEEDRSVEAVNHLAKLIDTEEDLAKWTGTILPGVWGTFGDSLPLEGLTEASNETAKVGKLTGVLADALNWAGVNEDDFQASLDKCTTEQERQALITETLNKLYGTAAKNYKKNNASIIESRKASSDYTDTMAELGETVEPLQNKMTEGFNKLLKSILGLVKKADMKKLQKNIEKAFDGIVNTVLPAVINGFKWLMDNWQLVAAGLSGVFAFFTAQKVITGIMNMYKQIKMLFTFITTWTTTNPIGLIATAVGLLTAGFVALATSEKEFTEATQEQIDASNELLDSMNERKTAYDDMKKAAEEAAAGNLSELGHIEQLYKELQNLTDAQGNVAKGDQERVKFILGEMNEAFGTEYKLVDGTIQKYGELEKQIDDVINKKRAQYMLEPLEESYAQAVQNVAQAEQDLGLARADLEETTDNITMLTKEYNDAVKATHDAMADPTSTLEEIRRLKERGDALYDNLEEEKAILSVRQEAYNTATGEYYQYLADMEKYETASSLILENKTDEAINYMKTTSTVASDASKLLSDTNAEAVKKAEENLRVQEAILAELKEKYAQGSSVVTKAMIKSAEDAVKTANEDLKRVGESSVDSVNSGVTQSSYKLLNNWSSIFGSIKKKLNESGLNGSFNMSINGGAPRMATGGVVSRATHAIIGEDGAEAVVPLEKNTAWIDKLADKIVAKTGGGGSVVVNQTNNYSEAHSRYEIFRSKEATARAVKLAMKGA